MRVIHEQFSDVAVLSLAEQTVALLVENCDPVVTDLENDPFEIREALLRTVDPEVDHSLDRQPVEIRLGQLSDLHFGHVHDQHRVDPRLKVFEPVRLPHRRLVEPLGTVFLPIVPLRIVPELVGENRIAPVEYAAEFVENNPRQFIRLDRKSKQREERNELVVRDQTFDPTEELRCHRAHSVLVKVRFRMKSDAFLLPDSLMLRPAVVRRSYPVAYFFDAQSHLQG